jgi:hypothetical protein
MVTMNSATVLVAQRTVATIAVAAVVLLVCGSIARTEDVGVASGLVRDAESPVEQFSQQLEDFQKAVPDLNKSIQDSIGTIDSATDVDKARAEIDGLRATVSTLLNAISDNGPVSQLGVKALDHIHDKLKDLPMPVQRHQLENDGSPHLPKLSGRFPGNNH